MEPVTKAQKIEALCALLAQTTDPGDMTDLLGDLCTPKEISTMAERLFAAKLLLEGNTYNQVMAQAEISSATLSRVSRSLQQGNGYTKLLQK